MDVQILNNNNPFLAYVEGVEEEENTQNALQDAVAEQLANIILTTDFTPNRLQNRLEFLASQRGRKWIVHSTKKESRHLLPVGGFAAAGGIAGLALGGPLLVAAGAGLGAVVGIGQSGGFIIHEKMADLKRASAPENPYNHWFRNFLDETQRQALVTLIRRRRDIQNLIDIIGNGELLEPYKFHADQFESPTELARAYLLDCVGRRPKELCAREVETFFRKYDPEENVNVQELLAVAPEALRGLVNNQIAELMDTHLTFEQGTKEVLESYLKTFTSFSKSECHDLAENIHFLVKAKSGRILSLETIRQEANRVGMTLERLDEQNFERSQRSLLEIGYTILQTLRNRDDENDNQENIVRQAMQYMWQGIAYIQETRLQKQDHEALLLHEKGVYTIQEYQEKVEQNYQNSGYRYFEDGILRFAREVNELPPPDEGDTPQQLTQAEIDALERMRIQTEFHGLENRGRRARIVNYIINRYVMN